MTSFLVFSTGLRTSTARSVFFRRLASTPPPGISRLALTAAERHELQKVAGEKGPLQALQHLTSSGNLEVEPLQTECARHLQNIRNLSFAYASDMQEWRIRYSRWLALFRMRLRDARAQDNEKIRAAKSNDSATKHASTDVSTKNHGDYIRTEQDAAYVQLRVRLERLAVDRPPKPKLDTQGVFIWGGVGRGKSLLMDLFMSSFSCSGGGPIVQRHHYHDFMTGVHEQLHKKRQAGGSKHAVKSVAADMARGSPLILCLDELQITSISDAVILRDLFGNLFANGALLVTTCNRPPEDLYKDGLNHMIYMPPFLKLLRDRMYIHHLDSTTDYRVKQYESEGLAGQAPNTGGVSGGVRTDFIVAPVGYDSLDALFKSATRATGESQSLLDATPRELLVSWGRRLKCRAVQAGVARFTFQELCGAPLGADDYSALIRSNDLHTFVVSDIPKFSLQQHNEARRFTNFVDCLYEAQCRLICTAQSEPDDLMSEMASLSDVDVSAATPPTADDSKLERSVRRHGDVSFEVSALSPCRPDTFATAEADAESGTGDADILQAVLAARKRGTKGDASPASVDPTEQDGVAGVTSAALVSLQESGFAARRCVSRLKEMSTEAYYKAHLLSWMLEP